MSEHASRVWHAKLAVSSKYRLYHGRSVPHRVDAGSFSFAGPLIVCVPRELLQVRPVVGLCI